MGTIIVIHGQSKVAEPPTSLVAAPTAGKTCLT